MANENDPGSNRQIKQRDRVAKLYNVCTQYNKFSGDNGMEYLEMISCIIAE